MKTFEGLGYGLLAGSLVGLCFVWAGVENSGTFWLLCAILGGVIGVMPLAVPMLKDFWSEKQKMKYELGIYANEDADRAIDAVDRVKNKFNDLESAIKNANSVH
jgi:hypothetical protein